MAQPSFVFSISASIAVLAALNIAGCRLGAQAHAPPSSVAAVVVEMGLISYDPPTVTIRAGEAVEWRNSSFITHTVTADPSSIKLSANGDLAVATFDSGNVTAGDVYLHKFDVPGTYRYLCTHHEDVGMVGTVIVTP